MMSVETVIAKRIFFVKGVCKFLKNLSYFISNSNRLTKKKRRLSREVSGRCKGAERV